MKKLSIALAVSGIVSMGAMSTVQAQSAFEGAYGQVGIGYESISPSFNSGNANVYNSGGALIATYPIASSISNSNSFAGAIGVGYYFAVTKDFLMGIGAEYNPITGQSANFSQSNARLGSANGTWNKQNSYNIFISPATPIGQNGLLYGKVGYTGASVQASSSGQSTTYSLNGYSLGLGYKQFIQGGLYGFGEVNYANYGNQTNTASYSAGGYTASGSSTIGANSVNFLVGIGYKF